MFTVGFSGLEWRAMAKALPFIGKLLAVWLTAVVPGCTWGCLDAHIGRISNETVMHHCTRRGGCGSCHTYRIHRFKKLHDWTQGLRDFFENWQHYIPTWQSLSGYHIWLQCQGHTLQTVLLTNNFCLAEFMDSVFWRGLLTVSSSLDTFQFLSWIVIIIEIN